MPGGLAESEAGFMATVIEAAHLFGWKVAHFRPARTAHGWRTPVEADGAGWPDLFMVRGDQGLARECKRDASTEAARARQVTPDQLDWIERLGQLHVVTSGIWRPVDWPTIEAELRGGNA